MNFISRIKREVGFTIALKRLMKNVEGIDRDSDVLIADDIEASVDAHRGNVAFIFGNNMQTYAEFDARANRIAHWALGQGFQAGDAVALFMENCPDYVTTWFGLTKVGVVTALINSNLDGSGLAHCLNIASAKAVITSADLARRVAGISGHLEGKPSLWDWDGVVGEDLNSALAGLPDERPDRKHRAHLRGHDLFLFVYTSGTTGLPKAAKISNMRARRSFRIGITTCNLTDQDRIYITLPLYHVTGGFVGLGGALLSGATAILRAKFSASRYWDDVSDHGATVIVYIGELCRYLLNQPEHIKERAHKIRTGIGNGLRPDIWQKFVDRFAIPKLLEIYGSTEGNVFLMNFDGKIGAVGRIPKYLEKNFGDVRIVKFDVVSEEPVRGDDGHCMIADLGEPGELLGRIDQNGPSDFSGYHDKKATEKKILRDAFEKGDAWFRTGDLMSKDAEGYIYFNDRIGDTFRWKGENVATNEVAEALSQYPGIETANVYGVPIKGTDGKAGMASLTVDESFDIDGLKAHLAGALPPYAAPVFIRIQPEADTTGTFKYRKVELVKEGFDPSQVDDPLWFSTAGSDAFEALDADEYSKILGGEYQF
ncbi:long-chain-acyl-CoA synthetase [Parasphingorhabdus halotolerans]|uniref:Long-chain-acyl-CoA synthetase n=1 Tax=Parasphingorhabdus halotolerans TaxID=2725558 RepID=A0A6H2DLA6_9SPHN|nr:long-chain-acyl-CoA synthetase [Parasphingorhabdus halotolerans]QJB68735.1 long-chain-acyl-CoA synthetase [Parasphingorhabdus halotolerans]